MKNLRTEQGVEAWRPDANQPTPLYEQIRRYIRQKIAGGDWPAGMKLPPQRQLAQGWHVNRSTLIEALEELKAEGLLESRTGSGIQVANNTWALFAKGSGTNWNRYVEKGLHHPNQPTVQAINQYEYEPGIIRLGTGELSPNLYPSEMAQVVMARAAERIADLSYLPGKGLLPLRVEICRRLKQYGIEAEPSQVMITNGALQAIHLICMGITPQGATILVESPSYLQSLRIFQSSGMTLKGIAMDTYGIRVDQLKHMIRTKETPFLYTIPNFHNPTGITMPQERRNALLEVCQSERIPVVEDDVYRDLWLDGPPPTPLKAQDRYGNVLYLGSLSKSLAPGFRIGWVVGSESAIERMADIKMQTDYGSSSFSQWIAAEWLESGMYDQHLATVRQELIIRRSHCESILNQYFKDLATWTIPSGGFYIWLKLRKGISLKHLFEKAYQSGLLLNPGYLYEHEESQHLRLSYGYASFDELSRGLEALSKMIQSFLEEKI